MTVLLFLLLCAIASAMIAGNKGRSGLAWFVLGLLIGPFGILFALIVSDERKAIAEERAKADEAINTRTCPFCAERIKREAIVCRYCGRDVPPETVAEPTERAADASGGNIENWRTTATQVVALIVVVAIGVGIWWVGKNDAPPAKPTPESIKAEIDAGFDRQHREQPIGTPEQFNEQYTINPAVGRREIEKQLEQGHARYAADLAYRALEGHPQDKELAKLAKRAQAAAMSARAAAEPKT